MNIKFIFAFATLFIFASCQKEGDVKPTPSNSKNLVLGWETTLDDVKGILKAGNYDHWADNPLAGKGETITVVEHGPDYIRVKFDPNCDTYPLGGTTWKLTDIGEPGRFALHGEEESTGKLGSPTILYYPENGVIRLDWQGGGMFNLKKK